MQVAQNAAHRSHSAPTRSATLTVPRSAVFRGADGNFAAAADQIFVSQPLVAGPNNLSFAYHTVTQDIGYDGSSFRYVNIEWQPVTGVKTGFITMGEVTFKGIPIPEPVTIMLLGLGGVLSVLVRRRRA